MIARLIELATSSHVLRPLAVAGAVGCATAFVVHAATLDRLVNDNGKPIGGDFIAGYTGGTLVLRGQSERLFDLVVQQDTQRQILGIADHRGLGAFVNPPAVAAAFVPFALLPYRVAYIAYTLAMAAAFLVAMRRLRPFLPGLQRQWGIVIGVSLLFYPLFITITGGQNTALSLLLLVAAFTRLREGRDARAGVALGLLFFKPQLALLFCLLLLPSKRYRCFLAAGAVAWGYYLVGAVLCGVWWPLDLIEMYELYWPIEHQFNGLKSISLIGFCEYVLAPPFAKPAGILLTIGLVGALAWLWRKADPRSAGFARHWGMAACATLLVSPHTQWYDSGLVLLAVLLGLNDLLVNGHRPGTTLRAALLAGFLLAPAYSLADYAGWQPLVLLPTVALVWLLRLPGARPRSEAPTPLVA